MQALDLPPFEPKLTQSATNQPLIWDGLRRKHVVLTPEEWVRQHVVHYLINHLGYPRGLLALERGLRYNQRQKRTDLLARDPAGQPLLLVECKAPTVPITQAVARQAGTGRCGVGDFDHHVAATQLGRDFHVGPQHARLYTVLHGVFNQRLQQQRRQLGRVGAAVHGPLHAQAAAKADLLNLKIAPGQRDLLLQRAIVVVIGSAEDCIHAPIERINHKSIRPITPIRLIIVASRR